jgi:hypothetical protein
MHAKHPGGCEAGCSEPVEFFRTGIRENAGLALRLPAGGVKPEEIIHKIRFSAEAELNGVARLKPSQGCSDVPARSFRHGLRQIQSGADRTLFVRKLKQQGISRNLL